MTQFSRRIFLTGTGAALLLAGCENAITGNGVGTNGAAKIDARVQATREYLFGRYPGTRDLEAKAKGVLYIPLVTEAGFGIGGSYGQGALLINGVTVDYYSATRATIGFQIGAQQYAHALFFMTDQALEEFRRSNGWAAGADVTYATPDQGGSLGTSTTEIQPVIGMIFGQQGLIAGATLAGVKYSRIIP